MSQAVLTPAVPGSAKLDEIAHPRPNLPLMVFSILGTMRSELLSAGCSYRSHCALAVLTPPRSLNGKPSTELSFQATSHAVLSRGRIKNSSGVTGCSQGQELTRQLTICTFFSLNIEIIMTSNKEGKPRVIYLKPFE